MIRTIDDDKHRLWVRRKVTLVLFTLVVLTTSWLGVYWVEIRAFFHLSCEYSGEANQEGVATTSLRGPSNGKTVQSKPNWSLDDIGDKIKNEVEADANWSMANEEQPNQHNDVLPINGNNNENKQDVKPSRPRSMLAIYEGDEGSTVMTEALRLHPQVYSPDWKAEPANARHWSEEEFTLQKQLDAIRFLLRLPSSMKTFDVNVNKSIPLEDYQSRVGDADATYIKVNVCRNVHNNVQKFSKCMSEAFSDLFCGDNQETLDHLIVPLRYGFDRACSMYVHSDRTLYKQFSQFMGGESESTKELDLVSVSEETAKSFTDKQKIYISYYMAAMMVSQQVCPNKAQGTKIHIFDYDHAKSVGMEVALTDLFGDLDLEHDSDVVDLGQFGERKPGNYCGRIFDEESMRIWQQQHDEYNEWLESFCVNEDGNSPTHPWCEHGIPIVMQSD